ncbi:ABC-type phosphate transport system, periplasmic component [Spirochaeta africana DSM 8902]|uniref:ABC-type phosphate transport system, periplasmic component n=2 Tax=Spirochaeta TaxID=146 RepID=H9UGU9_SPIAZ|nr:ABC-type phosphate transport system, periplasmic component [Spirochaeta africana DSM 8902]
MLGGLAAALLMGSCRAENGDTSSSLAQLPAYVPAERHAGTIQVVGSDTLRTALLLLTDAYHVQQPAVEFELHFPGSDFGAQALADGQAQLAPMSRALAGHEYDEVARRTGQSPLQVPVAIDAVAVYVHRENPVESADLQQLAQVFGDVATEGDAVTWSMLGGSGDWAARSLQPVGRAPGSGTYELFRTRVLQGAGFAPAYRAYPGSSSTVRAVAADAGLIGYSGIGYNYAGVRPLALSEDGGAAYQPLPEHILSGRYPLVRPLYIYASLEQGLPEETAAAMLDFLLFVVSRQGQQLLARDGFILLDQEDLASVRTRLETAAAALSGR